MSLKNHFLVEDYPMMIDEIDNLHHTFIKILNSVENADFTTKEEQLSKLNHSLVVLQALHKKKILRERANLW